MSAYDVIVVGLGGMGSATLYQLARRGQRVLGLEQFDIPHEYGSSHGITRLIRQAYFEDPSYVPLLLRAYRLWGELEERCGEKLLHITGGLDIAVPGDDVFDGSLESCRVHDLPHRVLSAGELNQRFPGYRLPSHYKAVFQPDGGFLSSERCLTQFIFQSLQEGATVRAREPVLDWNSTRQGVTVRTDRGCYSAGALVLTAGPWLSRLVPHFASRAVVERQVLGWFQPSLPEHYAEATFPVFNMRVEEGHFYGFPVFHVPGFKIGRYHHLKETVDPDTVSRRITRRDEHVLREAVSRYFPDADGPTMGLKTCLFTNTPDEHFLVDRLPSEGQVVLGGGFSGHGFKFCSVIGEILADLALEGSTGHDISLFRLDRFSDPEQA